MRCPECKSSMMSKVYCTQEKGDTVERLRECTVCGHRYCTVEKFDRNMRWQWKNRHTPKPKKGGAKK